MADVPGFIAVETGEEGGLPLAIGLALASHMQADDLVTACFFGDGAQ